MQKKLGAGGRRKGDKGGGIKGGKASNQRSQAPDHARPAGSARWSAAVAWSGTSGRPAGATAASLFR
jgi:hypothetical protein